MTDTKLVDIRFYQSSSDTCALTGKKIETMEPHLRLFRGPNIPIKIDNEISVHEELKNNKNSSVLQESYSSGLKLEKTSLPCAYCDESSEHNVILKNEGRSSLMKCRCIECLNKMCSRIQEETQKYCGCCVYYDSAGVSVHDYPEKKTINHILEREQSKASTFIKIGRDDVGERTSVFPITDIKRINNIVQNGRKSRFVKKNYKDYNCDTCSSKGDGAHYKIGRNPDIIWNVIILCENCLDDIRDRFEEILNMEEIIAYII